MGKMTKKKILELGNIAAMVLCNTLGIPEGSRDEMVEALLEHFGFKEADKEPEA